MRTTDHRTDTDPDAHPDVPPNPSTAPGSGPPARAEPRGRDGQRPGRGALPETSHGGPAYRVPANPVAPREPPRGLRLFLRELALGLLDLFYPPRHP